MHDLLITGGLVVDGTGTAGRHADVAISDGRITAIGRLAGEAATQTIDAEGKVVAPGIVDAHTHYDPQITWDPTADTSTLHGVTTVAAGNCGFSVAPCRMDDHDYLGQMFARVEGMDLAGLKQMNWDFETFEEFLDTRPGHLGVNLGMYVGHSAIRRWVMGEAAYEREADDSELAAMCAILDSAMAAGSLGLSSSHAPVHLDLADRPVPSRLASLAELRALADVQGRYGRGSLAYAPGSGMEGIDAHDRALLIELSQRSGAPVITQGLGGRSKVDAPTLFWEESRNFLDASVEAGAPVYCLLMTRPLNGPFDFILGTSRYEGVPLWRDFMGTDVPVEERRRRISDMDARADLRYAIDHPNMDPAQGTTLAPPFWESLRLSSSTAPANQAYIGKSMKVISEETGKHPADVLLDIALADDLEAVFHWASETAAWRELLKTVQKHPQMIVGVSDGGAHLDRDDGQEWSTQFLSTWWRTEKIWRLEEAIRNITARPAAILGLTDRGTLAQGWAADVFIFDPATINPGTCRREHDAVTGAARFRAVPDGIDYTINNGQIVVDHGEHTGAAPGRVVRPS